MHGRLQARARSHPRRCVVSARPVPDLAHDAVMRARFGQKISDRGRLERRIAWQMLEHMRAAGFKVRTVYDGEDETPVLSCKAAMELMFNLDECGVNFSRKANDAYEAVFFVFGNGVDIVSDARYRSPEFLAAVESFDAERFA